MENTCKTTSVQTPCGFPTIFYLTISCCLLLTRFDDNDCFSKSLSCNFLTQLSFREEILFLHPFTEYKTKSCNYTDTSVIKGISQENKQTTPQLGREGARHHLQLWEPRPLFCLSYGGNGEHQVCPRSWSHKLVGEASSVCWYYSQPQECLDPPVRGFLRGLYIRETPLPTSGVTPW